MGSSLWAWVFCYITVRLSGEGGRMFLTVGILTFLFSSTLGGDLIDRFFGLSVVLWIYLSFSVGPGQHRVPCIFVQNMVF
jgi:hypothetical protein